MVLCLVLFIGLLGLPFYVRKRGNIGPAETEGLGMPRLLAEVGLFLGRIFGKKKEGRKEAGVEKRIAIRENSTPEERIGSRDNPLFETKAERNRKIARIYGVSYLVALAGALFGSLVAVAGMFSGNFTALLRPEFGESREVQVVVNGFGTPEEVSVLVSGRDLSWEETEKVFDSAMDSVLTALKKDNSSLLRVTGNLSVPESVREVIRVTFRSDNTDLLSDYGIVFSEDIPKEGVAVTGRITLSYKAYEKEYEVPLRLFPKSVESTNRDRIEEALREADSENPMLADMELPGEISGKSVTYEKKRVSPYAVLFLFLIAAVLPVFLGKDREKKALKNREDDLTMSYTKVLGKFSSLLDAGMSVRSVFLKLSEDYVAGRAAGTVRKEYVFEEMAVSANRLKSGEPESKVYPAFGRRIGQHRYMKFASLLEINVKQGVSGLQDVLETEMQAALEERKNLVLKKGEEAGTKQLFPMLVMLGIVLVVLVFPVFMSL